MSKINKFALTASLLTFIVISAVAYGIYTRMVKGRVCSLKQSAIDTAPAVVNIAEYRRNVTIDLISTLNPTEEQPLVGLRIAYADSVSPPYLYDAGSCLISGDECIQVKEFEKNYCTDIMQVVKYWYVKSTGSISFGGKTFVYYLYPIAHNRSLIFLPGLKRFSLLSKPSTTDSENLMFSPSKNSKPVTGDGYGAKNAIFIVSEATGHLIHLPTGLYIFVYKKDAHLRVCTLIIFPAVLVATVSGVSCLYLVCRAISCGIVEREAIINNYSERVLDGEPFFSAADVKKPYSMYNSAPLDDLTKAMGRRPFSENLKALPEKGGYLCLFDVDKFKNISDTFGYSLGDEVLMEVVKILKSQISVDKGKAYRSGDDGLAMIYTGGALEELLSILREIVRSQVGSTNLNTSIDVAYSSECPTVERLKMPADERLYKSKKNGRIQISQQ